MLRYTLPDIARHCPPPTVADAPLWFPSRTDGTLSNLVAFSPRLPCTVGRYVLHRPLATGGMATVYLGSLSGDAGFSRLVAVKSLHPHLAQDPMFARMLVDEARLTARVHHPNVVSTLDVVAHEDVLLVVMEYIDGETLNRLLGEFDGCVEPVPLPVASRIAVSVLLGLHAAHEARDIHEKPMGIVHRDVSPQNVMVGVDGVARVLDFGIAKAAGRQQTTKEGQLKGKFAYMSPEQVEFLPIDRRSDVYAASVVLWEMLTGVRLFDADTPAGLVNQILAMDIPRPSEHRSDVSAALDAVVMRGLSREVEERYPTAKQMADELVVAVAPSEAAEVGLWVARKARDALERRADLVRGLDEPTTDDATEVSPWLAEETVAVADPDLKVHANRRRKWLVALLFLLLLGGALIGWFAIRPTAERPQPAVTPPPASTPRPVVASVSTPTLTAAVPPAASTSPVKAVKAGKASVRPRVSQPTRSSTEHPVEPKVNCDPPHRVDKDGIRRLKPECL